MKASGRMRHKEWKNGKYPHWTARIIWFQGGDEDDVRLHVEDCNQEQNLYPRSAAEAELIWALFKELAPKGLHRRDAPKKVEVIIPLRAALAQRGVPCFPLIAPGELECPS